MEAFQTAGIIVLIVIAIMVLVEVRLMRLGVTVNIHQEPRRMRGQPLAPPPAPPGTPPPARPTR